MDSEIKWLGQRISLLKTHLRELKQLVLREKNERQQLIQRYQQERLVVAKKTAINQVELLTEHTRQLTVLSADFYQQRSLLVAYQLQEELVQNERINAERANWSKRP